MDYRLRPLVEVVAQRYGEECYFEPHQVEPCILKDGSLGYTADLSPFGIQALVHIRLSDMPKSE